MCLVCIPTCPSAALDVARDDLHSPTWLNTNAMVEAALVELGGTIKVERDLRQRGLRPVTIKMGEAGPTREFLTLSV